MTENERDVLTVSATPRKCVGAGNCAFQAPDVFMQDEDTGIVSVINAEPPQELWAAVAMAEELCPTQSIHVERHPADSSED